MNQEAIDEERREQKINQELVNISEGESNQELYEKMDALCEDMEFEKTSKFFKKLEVIDDDSNEEVPANSEEPIMNIEVSEEHCADDIPRESDAQSGNIETPGPSDEKQSDIGIVSKYWLLVAGLGLVAIGMFGIIGLRLNIVQIFLLGIDNPFPGIGSMEPMGHYGSIVPFAIGIVAIFVWGFLSDKGEESEEKSEPSEKENPLNIAPTQPTGHVGAAMTFGMGIISLFVWGILPGKGEAVDKSDGKFNSVKNKERDTLKPKDMLEFEQLSSHKYA